MSPLANMDSADLVDTWLAWLRGLTCKSILDMSLTIMKRLSLFPRKYMLSPGMRNAPRTAPLGHLLGDGRIWFT